MNVKKILIVGTGLLGASLGIACQQAFPDAEVLGTDKNLKNLRLALKKKFISQKLQNWRREIESIDIILLAIPVTMIVKWLGNNGKAVPTTCLVMDVGSVKEEVLRVAQKYFPKKNFVGCHPLAGSHTSGPEAATADFFQNKKVFLCALKKPKNYFVNLARLFWHRIGANPEVLSAQNHDQLLAATSHLPQMLASVLAASVEQQKINAKNFSGKGLADTTRLALSDFAMWEGIFFQNRKNILRQMGLLAKELSMWRRALQKMNMQKIKSRWQKAKKLRSTL